MVELKDMPSMIITIAVIIFLGAAIAISLSAFKSSLQQDLSTVAITNESLTIPLAPLDLPLAFGSIEVVSIQNVWVLFNSTTNYTAVTTDNYNLTAGDLTVETTYNGNASLVSYTYKEATAPYNITIQGELGVKATTSFIDTIGTILGVAVLIGMVVLAFTFGKRKL